jgi:hypothetical protein
MVRERLLDFPALLVAWLGSGDSLLSIANSQILGHEIAYLFHLLLVWTIGAGPRRLLVGIHGD